MSNAHTTSIGCLCRIPSRRTHPYEHQCGPNRICYVYSLCGNFTFAMLWVQFAQIHLAVSFLYFTLSHSLDFIKTLIVLAANNCYYFQLLAFIVTLTPIQIKNEFLEPCRKNPKRKIVRERHSVNEKWRHFSLRNNLCIQRLFEKIAYTAYAKQQQNESR